MAWTYDENLPTPRDKVRYRIGDTDTNRQMVSNETLDALLNEYNNSVLRVAVIAIRGILADLTRDTNRSVMGISGSVDQATVHYRDLLRDIIAEMNTETGLYPGAISIARHNTLQEQNDTTMIPPDFSQGMFDQQRQTNDSTKWNGGE